ncbi:MAG: N-acetylglucosamine-6-phosphate deacetylase [Turicibacter sp.]|nr:N-acetylglucosamine-6-phosphate deacetylase [Turicibacter sp.]
MKAIINGKLVLEEGILEHKVLCFNEKILSIQEDVPQGYEVIDAKELYVSPGLIDVHIHGSGGFDIMDQTQEAIEMIGTSLAKNGVTSFLATTMTMSMDDIYRALTMIRQCMNRSLKGARVLGAHLEGPFINPKYKGAQSACHIKKPSYHLIKDYTDVIKLITYAPEMDEQGAFIKEIKAKTDIALSAGHTDATYVQMKEAVALGCHQVTHLFNAMSPLHHREAGVVGAALMSDVFTELIADNIHVSPDIFPFILDNKGKDKIILVTDCMRAGGMFNGTYELGGQTVHVEGGMARLENGVLAGSVLTLNQAVYHFLTATHATLSEVIHMASLNPAISIGIAHCKGSLAIGKDADIAIFDEEMNCYLSLVEGRIVYNKLY